ncbi:MAG: alpha/beta hydrolase, partial [Ferruginibacter sp.]
TAGLLFASFITSAQQKEILLWPNGAPGSEGKTGNEKIRLVEGEHVLSNIHRPSVTVYLPAKGKATGAAVVIAPGGGYRELWFSHEGYNVAKWLSEKGIAAFILKYRLPRDTGSTYKLEIESLSDIQRAIRLVRSRAKEWNVDTAKIGVMGFSAGGEVAALAAMRFDTGNANASDPVDRESSRPAFQALIYPANAKKYEVVNNIPPVFFTAGYNDRIAYGIVDAYLKYREAGVPAELHIYSNASHGYGVREKTKGSVAGWIDRFYDWLSDRGFLKPSF